jgi:hypothetical protein
MVSDDPTVSDARRYQERAGCEVRPAADGAAGLAPAGRPAARSGGARPDDARIDGLGRVTGQQLAGCPGRF